MNFIHTPQSQGYKCVFVRVCVFSRGVESFPCRGATALMGGQLLLGEKENSSGDIPSESHRGRGTRLRGEQRNPWVASGLFHSTSIVLTPPPQAMGWGHEQTVQGKLGQVKYQKLCNLPWPKALPTVLLNLRSAYHLKTVTSSQEVFVHWQRHQ